MDIAGGEVHHDRRKESKRQRAGRPARAIPPVVDRRSLSTLVFCVGVIVVCGMAAYGNSVRGVFVFDDGPAIVDNASIRSLVPLGRSLSPPPETPVAGRPVTNLTFAFSHAIAGAHAVYTAPPAGAPPEAVAALRRSQRAYHGVNIAIHLLAALTLFGILRRTLATPALASRFDRHRTPLALLIATIWLVHPLQTGSVTYLVQRAEALMGLFYLLTLYSAIRMHDSPRRLPWLTAAAAACALGMGSKEVMVTAPLVVFLYDLVFLRARRDASAGPTVPDIRASSAPAGRTQLYLALAASWLILGGLVSASPRTKSVGFAFDGWSSWTYLTTQAGVVAHYLRLAFVPRPLCLDYEWSAAGSALQVAPPAAALMALAGLTAWGLWQRRPWGFAGAWFFLILAPTSSVLPIVTEVAAEHRMYLPLAAVVAVTVLAAYVLVFQSTGSVPGMGRSLRRFAAPAGLLSAGACVVLLITLTADRNEDYASEERIWADTVTKRPTNTRARVNYANVLVGLGRDQEAEGHLREAVVLRPDSAEAHSNLGAILCASGRLKEGITHLERAIAVAPDDPAGQRNLGEALAAAGRTSDALVHFREALRLAPDDVRLMNTIGWILATDPVARTRDGRLALTLAARSVDLTGASDVISLDTLAAAQAETGQYDAAVWTAQRAIALARTKGDTPILPELEERLALYRSGGKFRQSR